MFLTNIRIRNIGPIETFQLDLPFSKEGKPEPLVLVGQNGSGKTIVLAHIADALHEFAKNAFVDVLPRIGAATQYFMVVSGGHVRIGEQGGCCYLRFQAKQMSPEYIYKSGYMSFSECQQATDNLLTGPLGNWDEDGHIKYVNWHDQKSIQNEFRSGVHCFFPSHRFEVPHWLNAEPLRREGKFASLKPKFLNYLDDPIMVESSAKANQAWLLDVVLDSLVYQNQPRLGIVQQRAVNRVIQTILGRNDVRFGIGPRSALNRITIVSEDEQGNVKELVCSSLDQLSAGQATLLNLFLSIIRLADKSGQATPEEVRGLVLIDEADAHLHLDLQRRTLPELIKLFPNVQFILSTHSPLLLLGLNEILEGKVHIVELPHGHKIDPEEFAEFRIAFDAIRQSRLFRQELHKQIAEITKPVVFVEGKTDGQYLRKAFEIFGKGDILKRIEIRPVGEEDTQGGKGYGKNNLWKFSMFLRNHSDLVKQRVLFLFDHDARKDDVSEGNIFIRSIPKNEDNDIFKAGIENLFPRYLAEEIVNNKTKFYQEKSKNDGGSTTTLKKNDLCQYICSEKATPEIFENFKPLVNMIISILTPDASPIR